MAVVACMHVSASQQQCTQTSCVRLGVLVPAGSEAVQPRVPQGGMEGRAQAGVRCAAAATRSSSGCVTRVKLVTGGRLAGWP
jgi:hypothetical protein